MEEVLRLREELKLKKSELRKQDALKKNAKKFCDKMRDIQQKNKVLFYYYRTTCQGHEGFKSEKPITDKEYYLEFFDYLNNSDDASWSQVYFDVKSRYDDERPSIQDLFDICVLFDIPYDKKVLTEVYNETIYNPPKFGCNICFDDKPILYADNQYTFRSFKKKNEEDDWVDACYCKVLICNECCFKLMRRCPVCRTTFTGTCGLTEGQVRERVTEC